MDLVGDLLRQTVEPVALVAAAFTFTLLLTSTRPARSLLKRRLRLPR